MRGLLRPMSTRRIARTCPLQWPGAYHEGRNVHFVGLEVLEDTELVLLIARDAVVADKRVREHEDLLCTYS